ncbi:hypothetical protein OVA24_20470 [Luteolibacter sp. SL250]|uniref:hypothetical protein n=1 Tax=Luteolibacter sp. SL250 TaxID=2995170 RepID=UPI00226EBB19|nr:hypothetical protein [Luteolibacter sp. SL250]WAC19597.1 hypothetical protein OVA24_20470 [Luteolibacter sp. SL250]
MRKLWPSAKDETLDAWSRVVGKLRIRMARMTKVMICTVVLCAVTWVAHSLWSYDETFSDSEFFDERPPSDQDSDEWRALGCGRGLDRVVESAVEGAVDAAGIKVTVYIVGAEDRVSLVSCLESSGKDLIPGFPGDHRWQYIINRLCPDHLRISDRSRRIQSRYWHRSLPGSKNLLIGDSHSGICYKVMDRGM